MKNDIDFSHFHWLNQPNQFQTEKGILSFTTDPETDFWQRTYYGFQHDNAHAFYRTTDKTEFTFTVKVDWKPNNLFDQCGVILYQDSNNWVKAAVEYDNEKYSRLGSVVTNLGFSDWSMTDISSAVNSMYYRLSRRGQDFLIEKSETGDDFKQMRIFHMHQSIARANIGVYACSPMNTSMQVIFSKFIFGKCLWILETNLDK